MHSPGLKLLFICIPESRTVSFICVMKALLILSLVFARKTSMTTF